MASKMLSSTAVVAKRNEDRKNSLDHFPSPPWTIRALVEFLEKQGCDLKNSSVLEPAVGLGHMATALNETFKEVHVSDIHDWSESLGSHRYVFDKPPLVADFLADDYPITPGQYDWIISNPPFNLCKEFSLKSYFNAGKGSVMLMRAAFLETIGRYEDIFKNHPPSWMLCFVERVGFKRDCVLEKTASATFHGFFVWLKGDPGPCKIDWIPPGSRKRLEKPGDYDEERIAMNTEPATASQLFDES